MFSDLIVGYLFIGGCAMGFAFILGLLELANFDRRFGVARSRCDALIGTSFQPSRSSRISLTRASIQSVRSLGDRFFSFAWTLCVLALSLAIVMLMCDLGRPDRLLEIIVSTQISAISVGAWSLVLVLVASAALALGSFALIDGRAFDGRLAIALMGLSVVAGMVGFLYTGVLLMEIPSVLAWRTSLIPFVFALSSLSGGIALALVAAAFTESRQNSRSAYSLLMRIDSVVIVAEAIVLMVYLAFYLKSPETQGAFDLLLCGGMAALFWMGLVFAGLVLPLFLEVFQAYVPDSRHLLIVATLVLVGACCLRICIVSVAETDPTQVNAALSAYLPLR
ncbi:polysulfide reductase NrfD [Berryella wangjianweii]|uniref:Polysulfide reductase NrfD n=1 Tax=Berryella wangjianweii TaxID=2734634 RepID=A0A6M8JAH7_9ACTN|nr:NrfD/PsrC family molybdoenzyme membrane anchor subunit [Berryella wangjianweii]QKF07832.1 polysulfide reductase NrfD [Berryella wangjianweii]